MHNDQGYNTDTDDPLVPRSPGLEEVKPSYTPRHTPQPFVPSSSNSPDSAESDSELASDAQAEKPRRPKKRKKGRKRRHGPSPGDAVLISYLEPNRPDIFKHAGQRVLNSASQSEAEDEEDDEGEGGDDDDVEEMGVVLRPENEVQHNPSDAAWTAKAALDLDFVREDDLEMIDATERQRSDEKKENFMAPPVTNGVIHDGQGLEASPAYHRPSPPSSKTGFNIKPPPLRPGISTEPVPSKDERGRDEDSTPISPILAKYAMSPSEADPQSVLPAMQKSPPRSASTHSPEGSQNLPSLQTTLSGLSDPGINGIQAPSPYAASSGHSPQFIRHSTFSSQSTGPSPGTYSHPSPGMSPPGYQGHPSHPTYWRRAPTEGSASTPSTHEAPTPASASGPSPAQSYPTPNVQDHRGSVDGSSPPQLLNGALPPNGPFASSSYKCTYSGCTAAPFQTQYLLNSHANVHSSNRPHFCPVAECPRGPGGKGFKRKNEMIRHGLVHQSPGYICPFCPDQQHRYPRPDNLQRHVRVHHVDKDRDDPQLRLVLAQRPEGGNRGRRRRAGG